MNRINGLILATVLAVVLCSIAASFFTASLAQPGQQDPPRSRKLTPACSCFCGGLNPNYINLFSTKDIMAGKCAGGPLPADKCGETLGSLPPEELTSICDYVTEQHKSPSVCPTVAPYCKPKEKKPEEKQPPDTKCEPPTPWFDTSLGCKELKSTQIVISGGTAIIYMCGYAVFHYTVGTDDLFNEAYRAALRDHLQDRGLAKTCCDKFEDAVRTGKPCNPRLDVDCDGQPNKSDLTPDGTFPEIDGSFTEPSGENVDAFPAGMTVDAIFPPDQCKGCRWELIKGVLKCNPDPTKRHTYESTWRCPSTGKVVKVDKLSKPGAPCPY